MADYGDQCGNQVRQTDEYGNPIHPTGTTGDYGTTGEKKGVIEKIKEKLPGGNTGAYPTGTGPTGTTGAYATGEQCGNQVRQTDEYGNPIRPTETTGDYGTTGEKKGVMEKIKEKLPGGNTGAYPTGTGPTGTNGAYATGEQCGNQVRQTDEYGNPIRPTGTTGDYGTTGEKKGVTEKIKEKLPGGNTGAYPTGTGPTGTTGAYATGHGTTGTPGTLGTGTEEQYGTGTTIPVTGGQDYSGVEPHEKKGMMEKIKEKLPGGKH